MGNISTIQTMMKFRAWDKVNSTMIYFDFNNIYGYEGEVSGVLLPDGTVLTYNKDGMLYSECGINTDLIFMQYVDRQDNNDKGIYQCDIIRCESNSGNFNCSVIWDASNSAFAIQPISETFMLNMFTLDGYKCTILGNQYEHPELWETK